MKKIEQEDGPEMVRIVERNINALLKRNKEEEIKKSWEEKVVEHITRFAGNMMFVYIHLLIFGVWVIWNMGWLGIKPFDPTLIVLATFAAVEAIFLTTFVLISQNRMNVHADKRADLDLQISLLTEHEVTRLMIILTAIAEKLGIEDTNDEEIKELSKDVYPEKVLDTMEKGKEENQIQ